MAPVLLREGQIGQYLLLSLIQQLGHPWETWAQLIGDTPPLVTRTGCIRLNEDGADGGGDQLLGPFGHQAQHVPHEVNP
jgi:hypothetical protein